MTGAIEYLDDPQAALEALAEAEKIDKGEFESVDEKICMSSRIVVSNALPELDYIDIISPPTYI